MKTYTAASIDALPQRQRANLMNCASGLRSALLVGTRSSTGATNLALFSNVFHVGAAPALIGMIARPKPQGTERHSLDNILATGCWTLNHVSQCWAHLAHQTSARYPSDRSEFEAVGLQEEWLEDFAAPFVSRSSVKLGLTLEQHTPLTVNDTHLLIGRVQLLRCPAEVVREDGTINLAGVDPSVACGLDSYHGVQPAERFAYAKPNHPPERLD
jgi:flavin reductase (DIM6/NTAB) family NADH-FMN oxidoreductase RutF